jgi:biotin operon repressor
VRSLILRDGGLSPRMPAEQLTPGAPWRIHLTDKVHALLADDAPADWVPMQVATRALGITREAVLQRIKTGQLHAVHIRSGHRKGLRIEISAQQPNLF